MLKSYFASLAPALSVKAGPADSATLTATSTDAAIGFGIMVIVQAATLGYSIVESPGAPLSAILLLAIAAVVSCMIPVVLFVVLATVSGRKSRIPLAVVVVSFYVTVIAAVSFFMSFFTGGGKMGVVGLMAYFMFRAARTTLGFGIGASMATALLVIGCTLATGFLVFVLPGAESIVPA